jgi:putative restriction endonuclease
LQINRKALDAAKTRGIASYRKLTGELAIAFVPEFFGIYVDHKPALHGLGKTVQEASLLEQIAADPSGISDTKIEQSVAAKPRVCALRMTKTALRDIRFRRNVLDAYGNQCAMCAVQLKLVEAAHIVPVEHPDGTDETCNGVALCVLHHRAYDHGLISFDEDFKIRVNGKKLQKLEVESRGGGAQSFKKALRENLHLPANAGAHPKAAHVKKANSLRGWTK